MKKVWFLSGLGADKRAFQNLDFVGWDVHFIEWIPPLKNETIAHYAQRLSTQIKNENPILIGYSFGGMMAVELAKIININQIIIIASVKNRKELPPHFRLAKRLPVYKLLPVHWLKKPIWFYNWLFQVKSKQHKILLAKIIKDTDPAFLKWAMSVITCWQNTDTPNNLLHIHGTADRVLPFRYVNPNLAINNGGHFMIIDRAQELSHILHKKIDS